MKFQKRIQTLLEHLEGSKGMIAHNIVDPNTMGIETSAPGQFSPEEITDKKNLENTAKMEKPFDGVDYNDISVSISMATKPAENNEDHCNEDEDRTMIDISAPEDVEDDIMSNLTKHFMRDCGVIEAFKEAVDEVVGSDFDGPRDFNQDNRINTSDVLRTLKKIVGEGSEAMHIECEEDENGKNTYKISQIDKKKLPKKIQVMTQELELVDDTYVPSKIVPEQAK